MAIDYDSGAGVFDKIGAVIALIDDLEKFEHAGGALPHVATDIDAEFQDIIDKLVTTLPYDREVRTQVFDMWNSIRGTLRSYKMQFLQLIPYILAAELDTGADFYSSDMNIMLPFLAQKMIDDAQTLDACTVTLTAPDHIGTPTGSFTLVASKYYTNVEGADASSAESPLIRSNYYRVICVDNTTDGAEVWQVEGNMPQGGIDSPHWENAGLAGSLFTISSKGNTLLVNGGFANLNAAAASFDGWTLTTGVWTTDVAQDATSEFGTLDAYCCQFKSTATVKTFTQTLPIGMLKPHTKYIISFKALKVAGATGTLTVGFANAGMHTDLDIATLSAAAYQEYTHIFNTGDDPSAIVDFLLSRTTSGTADIFVDEVCLAEMTPIGGGYLALIGGATFPALGDAWYTEFLNNREGTIQSFFARWYNTYLPGVGGAAETILDTIAE